MIKRRSISIARGRMKRRDHLRRVHYISCETQRIKLPDCHSGTIPSILSSATSMRIARVSIALFVIVISPALLGQDEEWRARNDRGNRYEGSRSVPVAAAPVVELIGFHAYRQRFLPNAALTLSVAFFIQGEASRARLTAREIERDEFYWMEPKRQEWRPGWNRFGPWPVRDVLRGLNIGSDNLAVLARLDGFTAGGGRIAPVFVGTLNSPLAVSEYEAFFIAAKELKSVTWQLKNADGRVLTRGKLGRKLPQIPFTIKLPIGSLPTCPLHLQLTCELESGESQLVYDFFHQPGLPSRR